MQKHCGNGHGDVSPRQKRLKTRKNDCGFTRWRLPYLRLPKRGTGSTAESPSQKLTRLNSRKLIRLSC
jgi:hypothetical protein